MKCLRIEDFKYICIDQDYAHYIQEEPLKSVGNYKVYDRSIELPMEFQYGLSAILSTECMLIEFEKEEHREKIDRFIEVYDSSVTEGEMTIPLPPPEDLPDIPQDDDVVEEIIEEQIP